LTVYPSPPDAKELTQMEHRNGRIDA